MIHLLAAGGNHSSAQPGTSQIRHSIRRSNRGEGAILTIDWCELSGPVLEAQPTPGFGSRLLRQTITRELAGHLDIRYEREGVCCTIAVPIASSGQQAA
jgi:two-component sensor histidine kinase